MPTLPFDIKILVVKELKAALERDLTPSSKGEDSSSHEEESCADNASETSRGAGRSQEENNASQRQQQEHDNSGHAGQLEPMIGDNIDAYSIPGTVFDTASSRCPRSASPSEPSSPASDGESQRSWQPEHGNNCTATRRHRPAKLSPYACIDSSWNAAIECETFKEITVTASDLVRFQQAMARDGGRRRGALRAIRLSVTRQSLMDGSKEELDGEFSSTVGKFFEILAGWGERVAPRRTLELFSAADEGDIDEELQWELIDCWLKQYRSFIRDDEALPCVPFTQLAVTGALQIWPPSLVRILGAMKGVEAFHLRTQEGPWNLPFTREEYRDALAEAVHKFPPSCSRVVADFGLGVRDTDGEANPVFDNLSFALRDCSTRLRVLELADTHITHALFWPEEREERVDGPTWPSLESVKVLYHRMDYYSQWFVIDDQKVDYDLVNELYSAAGRAARRMPVLKNFELTLMDCPVKLKLEYSGATRQVTFMSNEPLGLSQETLDAWGVGQDVAQVGHDDCFFNARVL